MQIISIKLFFFFFSTFSYFCILPSKFISLSWIEGLKLNNPMWILRSVNLLFLPNIISWKWTNLVYWLKLFFIGNFFFCFHLFSFVGKSFTVLLNIVNLNLYVNVVLFLTLFLSNFKSDLKLFELICQLDLHIKMNLEMLMNFSFLIISVNDN